jgi:hypothetical protein
MKEGTNFKEPSTESWGFRLLVVFRTISATVFAGPSSPERGLAQSADYCLAFC